MLFLLVTLLVMLVWGLDAGHLGCMQHRNVFTFRSYNSKFFNQPCPFVIMLNNQALRELETMSKSLLENDINVLKIAHYTTT